MIKNILGEDSRWHKLEPFLASFRPRQKNLDPKWLNLLTVREDVKVKKTFHFTLLLIYYTTQG
jgi:hypothetical protein